MDLNNAKVLVTGGSTGIGYEIAKQLKAKGAVVAICSRTKANVDQAAADLGVPGFAVDVSDEASVTQLFADTAAALGGLDVLVNNAGIAYMAPLVETSTEDFTRIWETNVKGAFMAGREAAKIFMEQKSGNIINISSTAGSKGFAGGSAYCSSKFAVSALTECWRAELRRSNVRVMQINPSEVVTPLIEKMGWPTDNAENKLKATEIAHVAVSMLEMNNVGFVTDATVFATNPYTS